MILKNLKLNNIRSYIDEKVIFPKGSVLLSGDIGSGKSTILLAIEFALFGLRRSHLPGNALLRNGKSEGSVELAFNINNQEIIIKRTLKRQRKDIKQTAGFIVINNIKTEATAVELKARILEILGYPKSELTKSKDLIYRYTVYTPQEQMKQILLEPADIRLDTLRKTFSIDKYKRIRENTATIIRYFKDRINIFKGNVENLEEKKKLKTDKELEIKSINERLESLKPKIDFAKKNIENKKLELENIEKDISILNMLHQELNLHEAKLQEILKQRINNNQNLERLDKEISTLNKEIASFNLQEPEHNKKDIEEKIIKDETELLKIQKQNTEMIEKSKYNKQRMKDLEKDILNKTERSRDYRVKLKEIEIIQEEIKEKKFIENELEELERQINEKRKEVHENSIHKENSEKIKIQIRKLDNCPTCLQQVSKEHKHNIIETENKNIDEYNQGSKHAKLNLEEFKKKYEDKKIKFEDLIKKEQHLRILNNDSTHLKNLNKEVIEKQKLYSQISLEKIKLDYELDIFDDEKISYLQQELKSLKATFITIIDYEKKKIKKENMLNLINEKNKNKEFLNLQQEDMKKEIGSINIKKIEVNSKIEKYKDLNSRLQEIKTTVTNLENIKIEFEKEKVTYDTQLNSINNSIQELKQEINQKLEIKKKIKILSNYQTWLDSHFIKLMMVIEKHIMSSVYLEFNELLQKWFNILIEDETINIRLNEEFTPVIEQNGYEVSIENLSGGEKTAASLAYRLALNKVINDVQAEIKTKDILILDEPTDGFSSAQLDKVRDVLDQINIKQVILVSHESKIESFVDNIIRINKTEHISQILS